MRGCLMERDRQRRLEREEGGRERRRKVEKVFSLFGGKRIPEGDALGINGQMETVIT